MSAAGPLAGRLVLDFSLYLPGPYATRVLADLGADVLRIEPPTGDPGRHFMPGAQAFLDRGKRAIRLDLKTGAGVEVAQRLLATADVVVEGFRPGVADRLGIGFAEAASRRPGVVYCSISGYGQTGPSSAHPGHNIGYEASGGAFAAALAVGEPPPTPYLPTGDLAGALFAATTISAHLAAPGAESVHVDVSLQEAVAHLAVPRVADFYVDGTPPDPETMAAWAPGSGIFATADGGFVALAAVEDIFWRRMCTALGLPALARSPYDGHRARMVARAELRRAIAERVAALDIEPLCATLVEAGVPVDVVRDVAGVAADPHLLDRGFFRPAVDGAHPQPDFAVVSGGRRSVASDRLPDRAADLRDVLERLGYDDAEIAGLVAGKGTR